MIRFPSLPDGEEKMWFFKKLSERGQGVVEVAIILVAVALLIVLVVTYGKCVFGSLSAC